MPSQPFTDIRQTEKWANYLQLIGWQVEKIDDVFIYIRKLPLVGSIIKIQRPNHLPSLKKLEKISKAYRAISCKIEPKNQDQVDTLIKWGFKKNNWSMLPSKTILIDLIKSEKQLLSEMHHKTRYNIGLAKRKGLKVEIEGNFADFARMWRDNMRRKGFLWQTSLNLEKLYNAFDKNVKIVIVKKNKIALAGVFVIWTKDVGYYMYAASTKEGNKLFAPTLAAWEAILFVKSKGCKIFDFEGIYDKRYHTSTKNWQGFTRFKKGFGGEETEFPKVFAKSNGIFKIIGL